MQTLKTIRCFAVVVMLAYCHTNLAQAQLKLPTSVTPVNDGKAGVRVLNYTGQDGKLRSGDIIRIIATPNSVSMAFPNSQRELDQAVSEKQTAQGEIAIMTDRSFPGWVELVLQPERSVPPPDMGNNSGNGNSSNRNGGANLPFTVQQIPGALEVVKYTLSDGRLRRGDIVTMVGTCVPQRVTGNWRSPSPTSVNSQTSLQNAIRQHVGNDGRYQLWIQRPYQQAQWVILSGGTGSNPSGTPDTNNTSTFPLTVRSVQGGVEVTKYHRQDGLFQRGDFISVVAEPGTANQTYVSDGGELEAATQSRKNRDGVVGLWTATNNRNPRWVEIDLDSMVGPPDVNDGKGSNSGGGANSGGSSNTTEGQIHMLFVYDRNPNEPSMKWAANFDVYRMQSFLRYSIPFEKRGQMKSIAGRVLSRDNLLRSIEEIGRDDVGPNDTFMVYYTGHGSNDGGRGHILNLPAVGGRSAEKVARTEVRKAMEKSGARLCLLITDSCANGSDKGFPPPGRSGSRRGNYDLPYWNSNAARSLFFRHTGFVDVNSSGPGEVSGYKFKIKGRNNDDANDHLDGDVFYHGAYFTTSLLEVMLMDDGQLKDGRMLDSQGRITWSSIRKTLATKTQDRLQKEIDGAEAAGDIWRGAETQTVTFLSEGRPTGRALPQKCDSLAGVEFRTAANGVVVDRIANGADADWSALKPGDRVTQIKRANEHFWKAVDGMGAMDRSKADVFQIRRRGDLDYAIKPQGQNLPPRVSKGMWIFSVIRNGQTEQIPVRVTRVAR